MRAIRALACLAALAGCASTVDPGKADLNPARAYALVSISHSGHGWLEDMEALYRRRGGSAQYPVPVNFRRLYRDPESGVLLRDTDRKMLGELKLIELEPGDYEFFGWEAVPSRGTREIVHWRPVMAPEQGLASGVDYDRSLREMLFQ